MCCPLLENCPVMLLGQERPAVDEKAQFACTLLKSKRYGTRAPDGRKYKEWKNSYIPHPGAPQRGHRRLLTPTLPDLLH